MANGIITGLAPATGGVGTVSVSAGGANQLTPVTIDPGAHLLTFDPDADMRLQFIGEAGEAGDDAVSVKLRTGGPSVLDVPGWGLDGPTFYLYCATPSTDCVVIAQRASK